MRDAPELLFGPYHLPPVRLGDRAHCQIRGEVEIIAWSDSPLPWPIGKRDGKRGNPSGLVLFGDLVKALRRESSGPICFWWGVTRQTVVSWRKALGIKDITEGTQRVIDETSHRLLEARRSGTKAKRNKPASNASPPDPRQRWTAEGDALLQALSVKEAAAKTGRSLRAVYMRRHLLGLIDGHRKHQRKE